MNTLPPPPDGADALDFDGFNEPPDDSLEAVLSGQTPEVKAEVVQIARKEGIPDNDPVWAIINTLRAGDEKYVRCCTQIETALLEGPSKIREASNNLSLAVQDNAKAIAETHAVATDSRAVIEDVRSVTEASVEYTEKMSRWSLGISTFAVVMSAWLAFLVAQNISINAESAQKREEWVSRVENATQLQKLAGLRLQLTAERAGFDAEWKKLQKEAESAGGVTPELQERKTKLEAIHSDLQDRSQKLFKMEDAAYEK